tara:strand:- start:299 stop:553 length:255 start_codon:yes stop_codon:yes gene_type:complete
MDQVSKNFFILLLLNIALGCSNEPFEVADDEPRAVLIDGSGTYSREISTTVEKSQERIEESDEVYKEWISAWKAADIEITASHL